MPEQEVIEVKQEEKKVYNTRPRLLARVLTSLVDIFLVFLLGFLLITLELSSPISSKYHSVKSEVVQIYDTARLETNYGYKFYESEEGYSNYLSSYAEYVDADTGLKYVVRDHENLTDEVKNSLKESLTNNGTYQSKLITYNAIYFGLEMLAIGSVELVMFLVIPLVNKRRQSIGGFVAITCLISNKESKVRWWQLLIRFLFILIVETALPLYFINMLGALLIVVLVNVIVMFISKNTYKTLRDYVSGTRIIDKNTYKLIIEQ